MRILLDSNAYSLLIRGDEQTAALETGANLVSADHHFDVVDGIARLRLST